MLALFAGALAASLDVGAALPLPEAPAGLEVAWRAEGARILVAGPGGTRLLAADGGELALLEAATAVALTDLDGDAIADLVLCGESGISFAAWSGALPGALTSVDASPCLAVATQAIDGEVGVASVAASALTRWASDGGTLVQSAKAAATFSGAVRLAVGGEAIAAASVGDSSLQVLDTWGLSTLATGGFIADVRPITGDWRVALQAPAVVRDLRGGDLALAATPVRLLGADLDQDGAEDLVVLEDGVIEVFLADGDVLTAPAPTGATLVAAGLLDGDGCLDLLVDDPGLPGLVPFHFGGCSLERDDDGDGVSSAAGDCDDHDPNVFPGASDLCNARDDDCDGEIDELDPHFDFVSPVDEGASMLFWPSVKGCDPGVVWTTEDPTGPLATCTLTGSEVSCLTLDDGELPISARGVDGDGTELVQFAEVIVIRNVSPSMRLPGALSGGLELDLGQTYADVVTATDPGADTVHFASEGGPDWFQVSPSGRINVAPRTSGEWSIRLTASDEDGGLAHVTFALRVFTEDGRIDSGATEEGDSGSVEFRSGCNEPDDPHEEGDCAGPVCGGSFCAGALPLVGLAVLLRRRGARPTRAAGDSRIAPTPPPV